MKQKQIEREIERIQCDDAASSVFVKGTIAFDERVISVVIDDGVAIDGSSTAYITGYVPLSLICWYLPFAKYWIYNSCYIHITTSFIFQKWKILSWKQSIQLFESLKVLFLTKFWSTWQYTLKKMCTCVFFFFLKECVFMFIHFKRIVNECPEHYLRV